MDPPGSQPNPNAAQQAGARPTNKRLQQTQAQVDEVVGIMKVCQLDSLSALTFNIKMP
jgi:hypothetical protein